MARTTNKELQTKIDELEGIVNAMHKLTLKQSVEIAQLFKEVTDCFSVMEIIAGKMKEHRALLTRLSMGFAEESIVNDLRQTGKSKESTRRDLALIAGQEFVDKAYEEYSGKKVIEGRDVANNLPC